MQQHIENRTFDEIRVGDAACVKRTLAREDILLFAAVSGDVNPAHVDEEFARSDFFHKIIAHGMWGAALISTVLGTELPGPGTIYVGQTLRFRRPVMIGDQVAVTVTARQKNPENARVIFDCTCVNQRGETVISGEAEVIAPKDKVRRVKTLLPEVRVFDRYARYRELMQRTEGLEPARAGVVDPSDIESMRVVGAAFNQQLIAPVLIGVEARIRAAAAAADVTLDGMRIICVQDHQAAAAHAVEMARAGELDMLVRGSLPMPELMGAIDAQGTGLRTTRHISHCHVLDIPTFSRVLLFTDAAVNVRPNLGEKRDIVQNAIDLAVALGIERPKVALLSASSSVDVRMGSTLDAAALCKMADRGQIHGGILDGPMRLDAAISPASAAREGLVSPIAGAADVLVVPDLEAGQMLVEQLEHFGEAHAAGLLLGTRVPVAVHDADDTLRTRVGAIAIALLLVRGIGLAGQDGPQTSGALAKDQAFAKASG